MTTQTLRDVQNGNTVCITGVTAPGELGQRLRDMGLVPGTKVEVIGRAPLGDPMSIRLLGFTLSLRQSEAEYLLITRDANFVAPCCSLANQACTTAGRGSLANQACTTAGRGSLANQACATAGCGSLANQACANAVLDLSENQTCATVGYNEGKCPCQKS